MENSTNDRKTKYYDVRKCSKKVYHMNFSVGIKNSAQENYRVKNINMILFLPDNIFLDM